MLIECNDADEDDVDASIDWVVLYLRVAINKNE
jgi:hypothetical protein